MNSSFKYSSREVKARANKLREILADIDHKLKHAESLEIISKFDGFADWNTYSAHLKQENDTVDRNSKNENPAISSDEADHSEKPDNNDILYCSFCGKSQHEVLKLIAGPEVQICDECVDLCVDIVVEERNERDKEK